MMRKGKTVLKASFGGKPASVVTDLSETTSQPLIRYKLGSVRGLFKRIDHFSAMPLDSLRQATLDDEGCDQDLKVALLHCWQRASTQNLSFHKKIFSENSEV